MIKEFNTFDENGNPLVIKPGFNTETVRVMLESFMVFVKVKGPSPNSQPERFQVWSNILTKYNPEGVWMESDMHLDTNHKEENERVYVWETIVTSPGVFEFTIRKVKDYNEPFIWFGKHGQNGKLTVHLPDHNNPSLRWTKGPQAANIDGKYVWVGNFISACQAESLGYDAVLNMAEELDLNIRPSSNILYKKIPCKDGGHNPIPKEAIMEGVKYIEDCISQGKKKILVHCRAGIGRSGSLGIAYIYKTNSRWSYQQARDKVWESRPEVYPHKRLAETLLEIFPRS